MSSDQIDYLPSHVSSFSYTIYFMYNISELGYIFTTRKGCLTRDRRFNVYCNVKQKPNNYLNGIV